MRKEIKVTIQILMVMLVIWGIVELSVWNGHQSENFKQCICSSRNERNCQDIDVVQSLYNEGKLTEFTNLQAPGWDRTSPGTAEVIHGCPYN